MTLERSQYFLTKAGVFSVIAACFSIPLSTSSTALTTSLVLLFWILSGKILALPRILISYPVALVATTLLFLFCIGVFYSSVDLEAAAATLKKYRELLFFPVIISFLYDHQRAIKWAENSFISGCIVLLFISLGMAVSIIPPHKFGNSLIHHIPHSYFMAILGFWTIHRVVGTGRYKILWLLLLLGVILNFVLVAPGRTGMLLFLLLMILFCIQRLTFRYQVYAFLLLSSFASLSYLLSTHVADRVDIAINEIKTFEQGNSRTSLGNRFNWYYNSVDLMKEKPFLGYGTGSFEHEQNKIIEGTKILPTGNPHNEYFFIGVQLGWVGLLLFLLLFILQTISSLSLPPPQKWMLQGMSLSMAAGCLMNSMLYDSMEGHAFTIISSIYLATSQTKADDSFKLG